MKRPLWQRLLPSMVVSVITLCVLLAGCGSSASGGSAATTVDHRVYSTVEHVNVGETRLTYVCFFTTSGPGGRNTNAPWCDRVSSHG